MIGLLGAHPSIDRYWLDRAARLASLSLGMTWPNPGVACILVRPDPKGITPGVDIGQGRHQRCGDLHGETAALQDCQQNRQDPRGATAYVTLAPCTRFGRQPPCVDALISAGVKRVVAGLADPHQDDPQALLSKNGVLYEVISHSGCALVHGGFLTRISQGRPRLTGKWAMTLDGCLGSHVGGPLSISDGPARDRARRRRRAFDGILIGAGTLLGDDPTLRAVRPRQHGDHHGPLPVVVAGQRPLPLTAKIFQAPCLVISRFPPPNELSSLTKWYQEPSPSVTQDPGHIPVHRIGEILGEMGMNDVLVEGGGHLHRSFLTAGLYDRLDLALAPVIAQGGRGFPDGVPGELGIWKQATTPTLRGQVLTWELSRI